MGRRPNPAKLLEKEKKGRQSNLPFVGCGGKNEAEISTPASPSLINFHVDTTQLRSNKMGRKTNVGVRRSQRLQNGIVPSQNRDIERVIQEITISESEKEEGTLSGSEKEDDEEDPIPEEMHIPEHRSGNEGKFYAKIDHLIQLVEAQTKGIEELTSMAVKKILACESSSCGDVTYRSLYIESHKKVETLMEENHHLSKQLENALGKIEVYEKCMDMFASLPKATEAAWNISSEPIRETVIAGKGSGIESNIPGKRKRVN